MSATELSAVGILFGIGLIWLLVNLKISRHSAMKTVSFLMMALFLIGGSVAGVWVALGALS